LANNLSWALQQYFISSSASLGSLGRRPNKAMRPFTSLEDYKENLKAMAFFWVKPLMTKKKISLRVRNFENKPVKVNAQNRNPCS